MRARIRSIKPEAFLDEVLWALEVETGLPIFRGFVGLWTQADREGRFEWRPMPLKAAILPYWDGDFSHVLDALATRDFVVRYESGARAYGVVRTFRRHQAINGKEPASDLPEPPTITEPYARVTDASATREPRAPGLPAGKEGRNQKEGEGASGTRDDIPRPHKTSSSDLARSIRAGFERRYETALAAALPDTPKIGQAIGSVVEWTRATAKVRHVDPFAFAEQVLDAFFASPVARSKGFSPGWLAYDPLQALEPPSAPQAASHTPLSHKALP